MDILHLKSGKILKCVLLWKHVSLKKPKTEQLDISKFKDRSPQYVKVIIA